jgi:poly(3-hydroxybutyrate) depolymerase
MRLLAPAQAGEFLTRTAPDGRLYRLYVPARQDPAPLVVMLHGCTQDPAGFAAGTRMNEVAEANGFLVAYPQQPSSANPNRCWNWFDPAHQARGRGEPA